MQTLRLRERWSLPHFAPYRHKTAQCSAARQAAHTTSSCLLPLPIGKPPRLRWLSYWQGQEDSNPRPTVLETGTLPAELYPCMIFGAFRLSRPFIAAHRELYHISFENATPFFIFFRFLHPVSAALPLCFFVTPAVLLFLGVIFMIMP